MVFIRKGKKIKMTKIHLIEANKKPEIGTIIEVNCGEKVIFKGLVAVMFYEDGRMCEECLSIHRILPKLESKTYAFIQEE